MVYCLGFRVQGEEFGLPPEVVLPCPELLEPLGELQAHLQSPGEVHGSAFRA